MDHISNENKIEILMYKKNLSLKQLSQLTDIPATTLSRIIKGKVKKPKMIYMEKIAHALDEPISSIFKIPELKEETSFGILPDEAGKVVKKYLSEEESMLLYLYQCSSASGKQKIFKLAKKEAEFFNKKLFDKLENTKVNEPEAEFHQMYLDLH